MHTWRQLELLTKDGADSIRTEGGFHTKNAEIAVF